MAPLGPRGLREGLLTASAKSQRMGGDILGREWFRRDMSLVGMGAVLIFAVWGVAQIPDALTPGAVGVDLHTYQQATRSWLAGDGFYHARQLAGPYAITGAMSDYSGDILYPPSTLYLFVPFLYLPAVLWWLLPAVAMAYAIYRHRPARWAWPMVAALLIWPTSMTAVLAGNPGIWLAAAVALATLYGWPSVLVLLKPTLAPFALIGCRRRSWWLALGLLVCVSLPFSLLWVDYARVLANARGGDLLYSARQVPLMLAPLAAWAARDPGRTRGASLNAKRALADA